MMKKTLFAGAALATLLNANASCDSISLQGLHFGLGFVVNFDEYEAEVDTVDAMYRFEGAADKTIETWTTAALDGAIANGTFKDEHAKAFMDAVMAHKTSGATTEAINVNATDVLNNGRNITVEKGGAYSAYLLRNHKLKRRATNCGGEVKIAYFHDFGNHLMFGVDFGCAFNSKAKKKINIAKAENSTGTISYTLDNPGGTTVATMTADKVATLAATGTPQLVQGQAAVITTVVANEDSANQKAYNDKLIAKNSGSILGGENGDINEQTTVEANKYLHAGDATELSFEKDIFAPRLAFVVGGTVYGWFAGVRTGVSYMTGKIRGSDGTRSINKSVSISSPFIGIQVMKQMPILKNNAHVYLTADWNMGDGHRAVNINGVKSYKQNNVNVALGVTWRCKFGA